MVPPQALGGLPGAQRDVAVETAAVAAGVRVEAFPGHTLYDMDWLLRQCGNRPGLGR